MRTLLLFAATLAFLIPALSTAAEPADIKALRAELEAQKRQLELDRERLKEQERKLDAVMKRLESVEQAAVTAPATSAGEKVEIVSSTTAPSSSSGQHDNRKLEIYGFTQLDTIYDFNRVDADWNATLRPSKIPVNCPGDPGCGDDGETVLSVRQSRFGVQGETPSPLGAIKGKFEFDLFGVGRKAGDTDMRLRHIWGEIGEFGVGQTNSLFMDGDLFPDQIDYWGPVGMVFLRDPQLRWTPVNGDGVRFAVAIEDPSAAVDPGKATDSDPDLDARGRTQLPDLTTQTRLFGDWGYVQLGTVLGEVGYETVGREGGDIDGEDLSWAGNLTGALNVTEDDLISYGFVYGEGIAAYMNDGGVDLGYDGGVSADAVPTLGWVLAVKHGWTDEFFTSVGYSEHHQDNTDGQSGSAYTLGQYAFANLLYRPVKDLMVGGEFHWGRRENNDNRSGEDSRLQFSVKYNFGATVFPQ